MINLITSIKPYYNFTDELNRKDTFYYKKFYSKNEDCLLKTSIQELRKYKFIFCEKQNYKLDLKFISKYHKRIKTVYNLFELDKDKELFLRYLLRHICSDNRYYLLPISNFDIYHHPYYKEKYNCVVDCGVYNMENISTFKGNEIFGFEPNPEQYKKLNIKKKSKIAISNKRGFRKFYLEDDASTLTESNLPYINVYCNTLDNIFKNKHIDFIKMDIESEEFNAINGGKNIIKKYKPELAISLYHKKLDFLDIPIQIYDLNPEYKFYLGNHSLMNTNFVLYCV